jgi:hypothetical protein
MRWRESVPKRTNRRTNVEKCIKKRRFLACRRRSRRRRRTVSAQSTSAPDAMSSCSSTDALVVHA